VTVVLVAGIEGGQIDLRDGVDHKPRKVPLGQPLAQARRQQQLLLTVTRKEVLTHDRIVLTAPDDTARLCNSHRAKRQLPE
jgi:hypothetical protein